VGCIGILFEVYDKVTHGGVRIAEDQSRQRRLGISLPQLTGRALERLSPPR
jgi:hypothetical protein